MLAVVALAVLVGGCSSDGDEPISSGDTATPSVAITADETPETTETTAADESSALTAETTGTLWTLGGAEAWEGSSGEQLFASVEKIEVTMQDGSVRSFLTDQATLKLIWPGGTTTAGVRVVIEEVDGEQRITGPAE